MLSLISLIFAPPKGFFYYGIRYKAVYITILVATESLARGAATVWPHNRWVTVPAFVISFLAACRITFLLLFVVMAILGIIIPSIYNIIREGLRRLLRSRRGHEKFTAATPSDPGQDAYFRSGLMVVNERIHQLYSELGPPQNGKAL